MVAVHLVRCLAQRVAVPNKGAGSNDGIKIKHLLAPLLCRLSTPSPPPSTPCCRGEQQRQTWGKEQCHFQQVDQLGHIWPIAWAARDPELLGPRSLWPRVPTRPRAVPTWVEDQTNSSNSVSQKSWELDRLTLGDLVNSPIVIQVTQSQSTRSPKVNRPGGFPRGFRVLGWG